MKTKNYLLLIAAYSFCFGIHAQSTELGKRKVVVNHFEYRAVMMLEAISDRYNQISSGRNNSGGIWTVALVQQVFEACIQAKIPE